MIFDKFFRKIFNKYFREELIRQQDVLLKKNQEEFDYIKECLERQEKSIKQGKADNYNEFRHTEYINRLMHNDLMKALSLLQTDEEKVLANSNSVFSYCFNQFLLQQKGIDSLEEYEYYSKIHKMTACYDIADANCKKIRVGKKNDGGYVMIKPYSRNKIAYSLGICDDVSWDKQMAEEGYVIFQYDHTIDGLPEKNESFYWKKIGITGLEENDELKKLTTLLKNNHHENISGMVLKMDIEGAEWDVLNSCPESVLLQFDQIVLELHNLNENENREKKLSAIAKLTKNHVVVHVHGNNFRQTCFCGEYVTPDVVEMTLVNKDLYVVEKNVKSYPEEIDQSNRPGAPDIWIGRW